jgi:subtilisin family serine protease
LKKSRSVLVAALAVASLSTTTASASLTSAIQANASKVTSEFAKLTAAAADGSQVRVYGTLTDRGSATRAFLAANTDAYELAESFDGFVAAVRADQIQALLASPRVRHLDGHRAVTTKLALSAREIGVRDAIWSFSQTGNVFPGTLTSLHPMLDSDVATGRGSTVAINDSGIDGTNNDFSGFDCVSDPYLPCASRILHKVVLDHRLGLGVDAAPPTTDLASGHGTHVAGIAAGNGSYARDSDAAPDQYGGDGVPIGVAPQAGIVSIKSGEARVLFNAWQGIDWAAAHAAEYNIHAVNNSWGCDGGCAADVPGSFAYEAVKAAYNAGVLVSFAAGNDGGTGGGAEFGGDSQNPYALSVANYDARNQRLADSSSRGTAGTTLADPATWTPESEPGEGVRRPDIAAPGVSVYSSHNLTGGDAALIPRANTNDAIGGGTNGYYPYIAMTGTSMSSPHVAGAAVLLFNACPDARTLDVMRALMASANRTRVLKTDGSAVAAPFEAGYGALDVDAALAWLGSHVPACGYLSTNVAPTAAFTAPTGATGGTAATFDAGSSTDPDGTIASYAWEFGDGATGTGRTVSHAYARSGTYLATLTVTDDEGATTSVTQAVAVANSAPSAAFNGPGTARHLTTESFDATPSADRDGSITSYAWDFGDGATAAGASAGHAYSWAGDYVVRLTVTDDEGASSSSARTVTVTDTPASGFKRLSASGLTNHKCATDAWTFQLKPVATADSPASVAVTWADGSRQRVARTSSKSGSTVYTTTASLSQIATKAWADVPTASTASFTLLSGPCQ